MIIRVHSYRKNAVLLPDRARDRSLFLPPMSSASPVLLRPPVGNGLPIRLCDIDPGTEYFDVGRTLTFTCGMCMPGLDIDGDRGGLDPRDDRLSCEYAPDPDPVDTFKPLLAPPYVGMGRKVGVDGREDGVGIELMVLDVAFVLTLLRPSVDTDRRDVGRRIPDCIPLCDIALGALGMPDGDDSCGGVAGSLNDDGAVGLDVRLLSLSLSLRGEGESSMISTHPDASPTCARIGSESRSILCRLDRACAALSS